MRPRSAATRRHLVRLRHGVPLAGLIAVGIVAACIDDRGVGPRAHDPVRLALAIAVAQAGELASPNIQAEIFYLRSPEAGPPDRRPLGTITQGVGPTTSQITLRVDIAPCLADPGRLSTPTGGSEDPTCNLEIGLTFRDGATALDRAVVSVPGVKPGVPTTAPGGVRLVAAGDVELSPPAIAVLVGQAVELTASVRDRDGAALAGRTVTWTSATTAVTVDPATSVTNDDGVATTTVTGVSEVSLVRVIATSGVQADTTDVSVAVSRGSLVVGPKEPAPEVLIGATVAVTATLLGPDEQPVAGRTVNWTTSDPSIATLAAPTSVTDANGVATIGVSGLFVGSVDITAESEGLTDLVAVKVQPIITILDDVNDWAASGINDAGTIVGSGDFEILGTLGGFSGGYLLEPGGTVQRLDPNNGGSTYDVNASGLVAGAIDFGAALFEGTSPRPLPDLESNTSFPSSEALALNDAGDAVGYDRLDNGTVAPVFWPSEGGVTAVGPASNDAFASGINAARQVVGYTVTFSNDATQDHWDPFIWTAAGGTQPLGATFPGVQVTANDINDAGVVVGGHDGNPGSVLEGLPTPYLWRPTTPNGTTGTITNLGGISATLPIGEAMAINEAGLVVGYALVDAGAYHGFLWVPPTGTATSGRLVDLGGGLLAGALDINSRFQAVGFALREENSTLAPVMWTLSAEVLDRRLLTAQEAAAQVAAQRRKFATSIAAPGLTGGGGPVTAQAFAEVAARIRALRTGRAPGAAASRQRAHERTLEESLRVAPD